MRTYHLSIGLTLLMLTGVVGKAAAFETPYHGTDSGTFILTGADGINPGDGFTATLSNFAITTDNLGTVTGQGSFEDQQASSPSGLCLAGTDWELSLGFEQNTHRFPNGDLLFLKTLQRTTCIDFEAPAALIFSEGEFVGGTGQFANATGSWTANGKGAFTSTTGLTFGFVTLDFSGTIITPVPIPHGPKH